MTRRRISNRIPRELTAKERSALSDVVLELDSDFRVKTGSVANISLETPEPGVIVLNEYDGLMYYADNYGWHQQGADWSPITLFVEFDGVNQFDFKFKAPADSADPSTLIIHDGDGTITEVAGDDDTTVTHTTNYSEAGTYYFYVLGDYADITLISLFSMAMVKGSVDGWFSMPLVTDIQCQDAVGLYGNLDRSFTLDTLEFVSFTNSEVAGDISLLENNTIRIIAVSNNFFGDLSILHSSLAATSNLLYGTNITFNNIVSFTLPGNLLVQDNNWTFTMVDNCLISLANGGVTGASINVAGNNASRTSASDAALATLEGAGCTVTVNE